jgi:hypothetical protein
MAPLQPVAMAEMVRLRQFPAAALPMLAVAVVGRLAAEPLAAVVLAAVAVVERLAETIPARQEPQTQAAVAVDQVIRHLR